MKPFFRFTIAALLIAASFSACKNRPETRRNNKVKGVDRETALAKMEAAAVDFDIMYFKGKADFESQKDGKKESMGFSYKIYLQKDKQMWASISKFGIPAATVLIDQDSVRMRVSLNKMAMLCDFSALTKMVGMEMDFGLLQSFFTGDPSLTAEKLTVVPNDAGYLQLRENKPPYQVSWFLNGQHFKLEKMLAEDVNLGRESSVTYSEFQDFKGKKVPGKAVIEATQDGKMRIELQHSNIELEPSKSTFSFRIPSSYDIKNCSMP